MHAFLTNIQIKLGSLLQILATKFFLLLTRSCHISNTPKPEPFILQKVFQRSNYNIKWGGAQNRMNEK